MMVNDKMLTDVQRLQALTLATRLHSQYTAMPVSDGMRALSLALATAYVIMHGAGILRTCGGEEEARIIEGADHH